MKISVRKPGIPKIDQAKLNLPNDFVSLMNAEGRPLREIEERDSVDPLESQRRFAAA
jgi:hypothetical protein